MISIMDFFPTLATITGAKIPKDRPIDGIDQSDWLLGKKDTSNREHLLTFIGGDWWRFTGEITGSICKMLFKQVDLGSRPDLYAADSERPPLRQR